ncbi:hypothetical protein C4J81_06420 [Deltaproteobacteria bacterium Smac51]|nr:hypothetical protein C4J81_06420 [Deltaproteobacteria bacterium Smac51]
MNDELEPAENSENSEEPEMPDGIGISYEDMAVMLAMKHDTSMGLSDPVMMLVSITNSFLGEVEKLHKKHNEALTQIITARTQEYIAGVQETTDAFSKTISDASIEGIRQIFEEHAAALSASKWNARWCALIVAVSALANVWMLALR